MKKLLSIILTTLIMLSVVTSVNATSETPDTTPQKTYQEIFEETTGNKNYSLIELGNFGDYTLYYNNTENVTFMEYTKTIGEYKFNLFSQQTPYDLGLYLISNEKLLTLEEAVANNIVTDMSTVYNMIKAKDIKYTFTVEKAKSHQEIFEETTGNKNYSLIELGNFGDYTLYYNNTENVTFMEYTKTIGEYTFNLFSQQTPYDLGLYLISNEKLLTLEEAVANNIVTDMSTVFDMIKAKDIKYTFTIEKETNDNIIEPEPTPTPIPTPAPAKISAQLKKSEIRAGKTTKITLKNYEKEKATYTVKNKNIVKVNKDGTVIGLQKGTTKITVRAGSEKFDLKIRVTSDPTLTKNGKTIKNIKVNKGKTIAVKITGKSSKIKNTYTYNKKAIKVISHKNATIVKIKGVKRGTTTLKIKVNNAKTLKLKVRVK